MQVVSVVFVGCAVSFWPHLLPPSVFLGGRYGGRGWPVFTFSLFSGNVSYHCHYFFRLFTQSIPPGLPPFSTSDSGNSLGVRER